MNKTLILVVEDDRPIRKMCIRDSGYGEYRDDPEAASWNAGQGRSSLCRWRMACYANSRNGSNVSSLRCV